MKMLWWHSSYLLPCVSKLVLFLIKKCVWWVFDFAIFIISGTSYKIVFWMVNIEQASVQIAGFVIFIYVSKRLQKSTRNFYDNDLFYFILFKSFNNS